MSVIYRGLKIELSFPKCFGSTNIYHRWRQRAAEQAEQFRGYFSLFIQFICKNPLRSSHSRSLNVIRRANDSLSTLTWVTACSRGQCYHRIRWTSTSSNTATTATTTTTATTATATTATAAAAATATTTTTATTATTTSGFISKS